ncbi:MAG: 7-cyano-7-deazaguanine synthase [Candidatus Methanomethylophilaceae archaeon]|jgi:thiamine biosynthesis protein ThiI|nr:7-cyano-7-deazaguanine synthase [Candidatus Methanomethylophilaceae archaeon]MBO5669868.1 7-cyano-7-deazaguanine synthase [Candidatus Methanomethylophilaceae archaeon]MBO7205920.1 7-cyano-7-deazaguanine synthase [Candidatus Methanomethylophilaceae archaeon]
MKFVTLLSGGIDSPVAAYLMANVGADVILLHMDNGEYGDPKEIDKVKKIAARLSEITGKELPLFIAAHGPNQEAIKKNCEYSYQCVMCKRVMQNVAKRFAQMNGCDGIIMGDSLGQVASQTLRNIKAEQCDVDFPIVRPLIGLDKEEIINIAKRIGTFDISIIQTGGCKVVPMKPVTEATIDKVLANEAKLDFEKLVADSADNAVRV